MHSIATPAAVGGHPPHNAVRNSRTMSSHNNSGDGLAVADPALSDGPAPKWKIVGPGLVVAATGVGAADMVATLVAGSRYGYACCGPSSWASF